MWLYCLFFHLQSSRLGYIYGWQEPFVHDVRSQLVERPTGGNVNLVLLKLILQNGSAKESYLRRFIIFLG